MTRPVRREPVRRPGLGGRAFVPALVIGLVTVLLLVVALPPGGAASSGRWSGAHVWTNGILVADVATDHPAVTVSTPSSGPTYGLYAGVSAVTEIAPTGVDVATASLDAAAWSIENRSGSSALALSYSALVPVVGASGASGAGVARVFVNFSSNSASGTDASQVGFSVAVLGWPWGGSGDELAIDMPLWPQNTSVAYLSSAMGAPNTILCVSRDSPQTLESFTWEANATARSGAQPALPLAVATRLVGGDTLITVRAVFSGVPSNFSALHYDPQVLVPVGAPAVALSPGEYAVLGASAVLGAGLGVLGLRTVWSRPSSLEAAE